MEGQKHILLQKLDEFVRKYYKNKLVRGLIYTFTIVFLFFLSLVVLEYFGNFSSKARTGIFFVFLGVAIVTVVNYIAIPLVKLFRLGKFIDYETAAQIIGKHFDSVKDKLLNTLQLIKNNENTDNELISASINQKINELKPVPFSKAIDISSNKKYLKYAAIPLLMLFVILFVNASIIKDGANRFVNYGQEFIPEAPFQFLVMNENMEVVENEDFNLLVKMTGNQLPNEVVLNVNDNSIKLRKKSKSEFEYTFKNIQEKKIFKLEAAGFSSIPYEITPIIKPVIMGYKVEVDYPSYTSLSDVTLENINNLSVPQGTKLKWLFKTKNTSEISFSEMGNPVLLNEFSKNNFSTEKTVRKNSSFVLNVANDFMKNKDSIVFDISTAIDQNPSIFADSKTDSVNESLLYFTGKISDDYGFSRFVFKYRKFQSDSSQSRGKFTPIPVDFNQSYNQSPFYYLWDLDEVNLKLGESLEYYFEVWDNDKVNGAKSARTQLIKVKAPTKDELKKNQEEKSESIKDKLEKNIKDAEKLQEEIKKMTESILNKKNMDWQDKKKMKDLLSKQKQLNEQNKEIQKNSQEKNREEQKYNEPNKELTKKQEKLDKLMEELKNEELEKIMEKIEKMMEKIDKSKLQKSLEEMNEENLDMKKEMERTLEMFKQMEMDEKLDEFAEEMEKLAEKQEELSEKKDEENTAEEQEKLNKEFKKAEEKLDELKEKNEELDKKKDLNEIEEEKEGAKDDMEESKEGLEKNENQDAQKSQKDAAEKMKSAASKAKSMKSSSAESAEENMEDLRALLENLITLSFDQEDVLSNLKITSSNDPKYVKLGQKQVKLKDDAKMIEDSLFALSKRIQQIEPVVNKEMNKINDGIKLSLNYIGERNTGGATQNQQLAMTSINNLALMLDEALKQMQKQSAEQKPGSGECNNPGGSKPKPGILSSMKKAKGEAGKGLGKLKDKMGEKGKAGKGKSQNSKELARMAAEQAMLRKAINEMSQELNGDGSGLGNELKKIEKDLEKVEEDIINNNINKETINRQQDILTRLLNSEKALREREFDEKRESKSVKLPKLSNPNEFLEYKKNKELELEQLKTIPPSLLPYYKNRVNEYFNQKN
ncbi:hypothetical protein N9544_05175 [Flavobacteriales bacterium]|nr:hypothetical protein [Flavobacteriales bacterium]